MFELKRDTPAAVEHSARVGLVAAVVMLLVQAATVVRRIEANLQDVVTFALIIAMGSDSASRLWAEHRQLSRGLRWLFWLSTAVAVAALTAGWISRVSRGQPVL